MIVKGPASSLRLCFAQNKNKTRLAVVEVIRSSGRSNTHTRVLQLIVFCSPGGSYLSIFSPAEFGSITKRWGFDLNRSRFPFASVRSFVSVCVCVCVYVQVSMWCGISD